MEENNGKLNNVINMSYTSTNLNTTSTATDIIQRLLSEGKITAAEAMVLLEEIANRNNGYTPYIPTYPTYPIVYECPTSTPPQRFYCTTSTGNSNLTAQA